jgi:glycosyltransferase involved in cell wall biosynthesis
MKSIWVINFFSGSHLSGWGERHFFFAKNWVKQGKEVTIFSSGFNHMFNHFPTLTGKYTEEWIDGVRFIWVDTPHYKATSPARFWSMLVFMWRVFQYKITPQNKPEVVIVSSMPLFPVWTAVQIKKKWKSKFIFEIRDIWPLTLQLLGNKSSNHPVVRFFAWFEKLGYQKADTVVSLLPNARNHIEKVAGRTIDFKYIPNGIDENLDNLKIENSAALSQIPSGKFIVGYTGTLGLANAMSYLVDAAIQFYANNDIHFVIVGDGYEKQELEAKANGKANITFISKVKKNEVQLILEKFDVCFIGWHQTELYNHGVSANKYFDYMLASKPILVSGQLLGDPVEKCGCGIKVEPESSDNISEGILRLKNMTPAQRKEMGEKGRTYVLNNHSIAHLAGLYMDLF